jgi:hypothetical protein
MDDMNISERWHLGVVLTDDGVEPLFDDGIRCEPRPLFAEVTRPGRPLDFTVSAFNTPIARASLANAISTAAGSDVQCLPAAIEKQVGFCVVNAIRVVRCIDEDRSRFGKWTEQDGRPDKVGKYRGVPHLRVDPRMIPEDAHFFRLKDWEVVLIVSEPVKDAMERAGCQGAKFQEVTGASELS